MKTNRATQILGTSNNGARLEEMGSVTDDIRGWGHRPLGDCDAAATAPIQDDASVSDGTARFMLSQLAYRCAAMEAVVSNRRQEQR